MTDRYTMEPAFEQALVTYLAINRKVYGALRSGLEVDAFPRKESQVIVKACNAVFEETGEGPGSSIIVAQKLRHQHIEDGALTMDAMSDALQYLEDGIDMDPRPTAEQVVAALIPQIKERMTGDLLRDMISGLDMTEAKRKIEVAETLGFVDTSLGSKLGISSFRDIAALKHMAKLPTGIPVLDMFFEGGAPRGQLFAWLGDSNAGKSTALGQQAGAGLREQALVLYGSNELPPPMVKAKIFGDLTDTPFKAILAGTARQAEKRFAEMAERLGDLYVKELDTGITTPADLDDWRKEVEDAEGRAVDLMCVDYADRMTDGKDTNASDYLVMKNVYNGLVQIAKDGHCVVATASQAKGLTKGQKYATLGDFADSRHKGRIANVVVSLNWDPELELMTLYICKQKLGKADHPLKEFPADWEFGRVSQIPDRVKLGTRPSDDWQADQVVAAVAHHPNPKNPFTTQ